MDTLQNPNECIDVEQASSHGGLLGHLNFYLSIVASSRQVLERKNPGQH